MNETDDFYPCAGICRTDPESGHCIGCGRPVFTPSATEPTGTAVASGDEPSVSDPATA